MTQEQMGVPLDERLALSRAFAPAAFTFPDSYLSLIAVGEFPDVSPVFWLLRLESGVKHWTELLQKQYPGRVLVPFAKDRRTDDVYCFDGRDASGNAPVLMIHSFADPGWEYRGEWFHFDSWFVGLLDFHTRWERGEFVELEPPGTNR
jgi:hypothetical protein